MEKLTGDWVLQRGVLVVVDGAVPMDGDGDGVADGARRRAVNSKT
jgi:hypothetical protein